MEDSAVNIVDIIILGIIAATAIFAFFRGFVREVLGVGSWIGAAIVTILLLPYIQPWVLAQLGSPIASFLVAGGGIFLAALLFLWTLTHILSTRVQASAVGALDRTLGLVAGGVKGAFFVSLLYSFVTWLAPGWTERTWAQNSRLLPVASVTAGWIGDAVANQARDVADEAEAAAPKGGYADSARDGLEKLIENTTQSE
jgi:membrane protein required for colicin V production